MRSPSPPAHFEAPEYVLSSLTEEGFRWKAVGCVPKEAKDTEPLILSVV